MLPNVAAIPAVGDETAPPDPHRLVLAHVGDWSTRKGADFTARVFDKIQERSDTPGLQVELVIAGHVHDVPIPLNATHLGYVPRDRLWQELASRGVGFLLLLSRMERWGFVVEEAMAAGVIPVVSRQVGSAPDLLSSTSPELIVDDPAEASDIIHRLHSDPTEFARVRTSLRAVEAARTSDWAVDVFSAGLIELGTPTTKGN